MQLRLLEPVWRSPLDKSVSSSASFPESPGGRRASSCKGSALFLLSSILLLSACSEPLGPGSQGELGEGLFSYRCELAGDAYCSQTDAIDSFRTNWDFGSKGDLARRVAVGSFFGVEFDGPQKRDSDFGIIEVEATIDEHNQGDERFIISRPGDESLLAVGSNQRVIDFTTVTAYEARSLLLWSQQKEIDQLKMRVGDEIELSVTPVDEDEKLLAGAVPYQWEVLDDAVFEIAKFNATSRVYSSSLKNDGDVVIRAEAAGESWLRVKWGKLGAELHVEVTR